MRHVVAVLAAILSLAAVSCGSVPGGAAIPEGDIRALVENSERARELFDQALALDGQPDEQKRLYREVLELDPSLGRAHNNLGLLCLAEGAYGDAVASLREAVKRLPHEGEPRFNLGYAYELIGRLESAETYYGAALDLAPDEPDYLESLARLHIRRRHRLDHAADLLERALALETRPEHVEWIRDNLNGLRKGTVP
jgi:Flp pilus assembly protein TadD